MANLYKQPLGRSAKSALCSLFGGNNDDLNESELLAFYQLKQTVNRVDDPQTIQSVFRFLYELYFQEACPYAITSKRWMKLGFQGERPETDLRAGGLMALQLIVRFVQLQRDVVDDMAQPENDFYFALASINLAYWLKMYFHLSDDHKTGWKECSRSIMKKFGRMLASNPMTFVELHRQCLLYLYVKVWMRMKYQGKNITHSHFNEAFQECVGRLQRIMRGSISSWEAFELQWLYGQ